MDETSPWKTLTRSDWLLEEKILEPGGISVLDGCGCEKSISPSLPLTPACRHRGGAARGKKIPHRQRRQPTETPEEAFQTSNHETSNSQPRNQHRRFCRNKQGNHPEPKHQLRIMKKLFISMLLAAIQLAASASADVTVASTFTFNVDAANSATYSSNPGLDTAPADDFTADSPMTIPVSGFTAAGTSKLVAVVSLHNSSRPVAPVTEITYGGVSILANFAGGNSPAGATSTRQMVFYLDNVATDGNLVLTWDPGNVDEVSVALFALNGAQTGTASYSELKNGNATLSAFNATQGDFLVGVGQRNNGGNSVASGVGGTAVIFWRGT